MPPISKLSFSLPFRQVHLDFHTGPNIPDVGVDFDPKAFAKTFKDAHVNSVTLFAKCHHGHLYYNTKRPERHPGLKPNFDLLAQQVDALHRENIRAPIYLSVQCDEYAANTHPEWVARNPDSSQVKWGSGDKVFAAGWQILDMSTPYQDFLAEQTAEVLKLFKPVDGIFFDMCWDQPSTTREALANMARQNLNPEKPEDRALYAKNVAHAYMQRFHNMVRAASKDATVYFNCRQFAKFAEEHHFHTQAEIEALPTGGWGYMYFPMHVRYARTFPMPILGMTARFHKSWADFGGLKPQAALNYETSQMIANGARCSVGDQLHPRGVLDPAAYQLIGNSYAHVQALEPWLESTTPIAQIGLFQSEKGNLTSTQHTNRTDEGATRILTQLRHQFDVVQPTSKLENYDLLILPDSVAVDAPLARRLAAYVKAGGKILASHLSGLTPDASALTLPILPIKPAGHSPFTATYLRFSKDFSQNVPPSDHVCYDKSVRVTPTAGTVAAKIVEPYFERAYNHFSSHQQTPGDKLSRYAAAVINNNVAYVAFPIFNSFATHGNLPYRTLIQNLLAHLLPNPLLTVAGPSYLEATVMRQPKQNRTIVHLLAYQSERRTPTLDLIEDTIPLFNVPISLAAPKAPKQVYLAPERAALNFTHSNGRVTFTLPELHGHATIVLE